MNRDEALMLLRAHKGILAQRFGVVDLALFGSIINNQMSFGHAHYRLARQSSPLVESEHSCDGAQMGRDRLAPDKSAPG